VGVLANTLAQKIINDDRLARTTTLDSQLIDSKVVWTNNQQALDLVAICGARTIGLSFGTGSLRPFIRLSKVAGAVMVGRVGLPSTHEKWPKQVVV